MRFLNCFTKIWPKKKPEITVPPIPKQEQTIIVDKTLDPISEENTINTTDSITTGDPDTLDTIKTTDLITKNDTIYVEPSAPEVIKEKLKPASKYIIGRKISPGYLTSNKYYFIKPNEQNNMIFFGKFVELDKLVKNKAIIRLSDTNDLYVFDYKDFNFFRAIPKKSI